MKPTPAPQNPAVGATQQRPDVAQVKQQVLGIINQMGADPNVVIKIGDMAAKAIPDKKLHPPVMQAAIRAGIADAEDFQGLQVYQTLASLVAVSKMLKGGVK